MVHLALSKMQYLRAYKLKELTNNLFLLIINININCNLWEIAWQQPLELWVALILCEWWEQGIIKIVYKVGLIICPINSMLSIGWQLFQAREWLKMQWECLARLCLSYIQEWLLTPKMTHTTIKINIRLMPY